MGYAARASKWKLRQPWQGLAHPHTGRYGLLSMLVDGVPEGVECTILLGVGPETAQQIAATLVVRGSGEAVFEKPVNLRDGVALWFKSSLPGVSVATRTADIVKTPQEARAEAVIGALATVAPFGLLGVPPRRLLANLPPGRGRIARAVEQAAEVIAAPDRPRTKIDDPEAV